MPFKCYGYNFIEVRIYIYIYAKWYYFCRKVLSVNAKKSRKVLVWMQEIIFVGKFECECKKVEKVGKKGVWFFFPSLPRIPPQLSTLPIWFCCPKSLLLILFSWLHLKSSSSFLLSLFLFLSFCFLLLPFLHGSPLSFTKAKYPSLKKKYKG